MLAKGDASPPRPSPNTQTDSDQRIEAARVTRTVRNHSKPAPKAAWTAANTQFHARGCARTTESIRSSTPDIRGGRKASAVWNIEP